MMLETQETTMSRDIEIQALGKRLCAKAQLLGVREPELEDIAVRYLGCDSVGCVSAEIIERPPKKLLNINK